MQTALPSHLATARLSSAGFVPVEPRAAEVELFRPRKLDPPEGTLDLGSDSRLSQDLWRSAPARHRGAGDDALDCCRPVYGNVATGDSDRQTLRRPQYRPSSYR